MKNKPYDIVVYGGTSAAITAAVEARRQGMTAILISPESRLGGMTTGGLGDTDVGIERAIGGMSLEFYQRIGRKYAEDGAVWRFEPKVALEVYHEMLREADVEVIHERLCLKSGVDINNGQIQSIKLESGESIAGKQFIDATYEGDLMGQSGVTFVIGRESNSEFGETLNGIHDDNELPDGIDPWVVPGDRSSGLIDRVNPDARGDAGDGDNRLQAYNFRMCLTDVPENRIMIEKPAGYREEDYEILFRAIDQGQSRRFFKLERVPNGKTDSNNDSGISTDYIGMNHTFPLEDYATREKIRLAHERYQKGLVWTLQHHPRVPSAIREFYAPWGLPKDEFTDNHHWPSQLYVRESRRMRGQFLVTEDVVRRRVPIGDSIGLGSYAMDSHHIQYCLDENGHVRTEGGFYVVLDNPYPISYRAILPKRSECTNLLVPVCVSATHAAYGSIRMEPVFMILGQSAAIAASLAIRNDQTLHDLPYSELHAALEEVEQRLEG